MFGHKNVKKYTKIVKKAILCLILLKNGVLGVAQENFKKEVIAAVLVAEAGGEGERGMRAVYEVIHNRAVNKGVSEYSIVTKKYQFSCLNKTTPKNLVLRAKKHPKFKIALRIVGSSTQNLTKKANFYHEQSLKPGWAVGETPNIKIGKHYFYTLALSY